MGVYQAGHYQSVVSINDFFSEICIFRKKIFLRDESDFSVPNADNGVLDDGGFPGHSQEETAADEEIKLVFCHEISL
ncbi:MAG: hypothetical protein A4E66_01592 [Syntrophus sp. PtaB.Bin001]|nr:MAG: hypothetical protein A4E66_01592 [Syntrophus sp. PtaB.Bin001]